MREQRWGFGRPSMETTARAIERDIREGRACPSCMDSGRVDAVVGDSVRAVTCPTCKGKGGRPERETH